ncbi:MAG: multidrug ABC transporter permease/ATP-binding protein [Neisseria sp.]|nr:multidrug ABC transporter permease/ATP-binding protein [Neisseria sp.]
MQIIRLIYKEYRRDFLLMLLLNAAAGLSGIAVLSYINTHLLGGRVSDGDVLPRFGLLLLLYLAFSTSAQIKLAQIGQNFIHHMQTRLVKRILDTDIVRIRSAGKPRIMASLTNDVRTLSIAFTRLPELVQGALLSLACGLYLLYLSPALFAATAMLLAAMIIGSHLIVRRHYRYFRLMRLSEDGLHRHYETALSGHNELTLNRRRAERFYTEELTPESLQKRRNHIYADAFHALAVNWGNSVMLASVGLIFYLSSYRGWADLQQAATIGMTVLFMRGPLTAAIGALPAVMQSRVAAQALDGLGLEAFSGGFDRGEGLPGDWQTIRMEGLCYRHPEQGGESFALQPVSLTLKRGQTVFLIGANGSGKSTLSMLLAGLYLPESGRLFVDDIEITDTNRAAYRRLFAAVFADFHLFEQLMDGMGEDVSEDLLAQWLSHLQLEEKAKIENRRMINHQLSQGQRKRLALLAAALERRPVLVLDEWAADQDPQFRRIFYEKLLPLLKQQGHTVFAISHDDKYFRHADRILSMTRGVLSEYGTEEAVSAADRHSRPPQDDDAV